MVHFNNVWYTIDEWDIFSALDDLHDVERWLREKQRHDAADEVLAFILRIETAQRQLLEAAERWASGDGSSLTLDNQMAKLLAAREERGNE